MLDQIRNSFSDLWFHITVDSKEMVIKHGFSHIVKAFLNQGRECK